MGTPVWFPSFFYMVGFPVIQCSGGKGFRGPGHDAYKGKSRRPVRGNLTDYLLLSPRLQRLLTTFTIGIYVVEWDKVGNLTLSFPRG